MGIFDDLGDLGDTLLTPIKNKKVRSLIGQVPGVAAAGTAYDLLKGEAAPSALLNGIAGSVPGLNVMKSAVDLLGFDKALALGTGAGFGFLAGGPPGAVIGGTAGLASAYAGPAAHKQATAWGLPDELGTAAEFGIYGVGGGLGLGSGAKIAGKVGMEQLLSRLALKSSLELGALSGVSAAMGQGGAKAAGIPEEFGILAGGIGGPTVGPYAFGALRTRAFNAENAGMKALAKTFGANEANSVARSRVFEPTEAIPGDQTPEETVRSLRASAESHALQASRYNLPGDPEYSMLSGGFTRAELTSDKLAGTEGAEVYTPAFRRQVNSLTARNAQVANSRLTAESLTRENADLILQWPEGRDLSELKESGGLKYLENADGSTTAVPDEVWQARKTVNDAFDRASTAETRLKDLLGVGPDGEIPGDIAEQKRMLRAKVMPDAASADSEATARFLAMSHRDRQQLVRDTDIQFKAEMLGQLSKKDNSLKAAARNTALADFVEAHPEKGFIPNELRPQAARDFEGVRQKEQDLVNHPHGYVKPLEAPETLEDYMMFTEFRANALGAGRPPSSGVRADRNQLRKEFLFGDPETGGKPKGTFTHIDPDTGIAKVKKLVGFTEDGKVTLRPDRVATPDQDITVPISEVAVRYSPDQLLERVAEQRAGAALYRRANMPQEQVDQLQAGMREPQVALNEITSVDQMKADLEFNQKAFEANFASSQSSIKGVYYTPEQEARVAAQYADLLNKPWKGRLSKEALAERLEAIQFFRQSNAQRTAQYLSVNDPEFLEVFNMDASFDPLKSILHLGGKSVDEYRSIMSDDDVKLWGATGQYLKKLAVGEVIRNPVVRQINGDIHAAMEASANAVGATYGPLSVGLDRWAAERMGLPMGFKAQGKAALNVLKSTRSIGGALQELHPLSHQGAFAKLAESYVNWNKASPDLKASLKRLEAEGGQDYVDQFKAGVLQNKRFFLDNQEMFEKPVLTPSGRVSRARTDKLGADPTVMNFARAMSLYDDTLEKARILYGDAPDTMLRRYMMNVAPEFREYVNIDALRQGSTRAKSVPGNFVEGEHTTLADVATETIKSLKAVGKQTMVGGGNRPLSQLMVFGDEADMAVPLATHQSMAMRSGVEKLKAFAKEPITSDDIQFNGHGWQVRSLNKFPKEMEQSIAGMNQVLSGKHQWAGLQRISQQIALGNLTADMSIMGIQGFKYLAHSLLAGNLIDGPKNFLGAAKVKSALGTQTTHIMSDWGFYSWLRQNYDEVSYLSQNGLTGGLKGYIAGPDIGRLPLENVPGLGKAMTGIREGTDLAFNRLLFYWKVQGVRENLEFSKTMRAVGKDFAARVIDGSPTAAGVRDDMGGLDNYLYGDKEEVVKSVVRQVNRSYGGVNMAAEGIGPTRQALEQIMTVVPGFFRAQAGQWASVITKPHTLEGQMAISMLSREYLFAAGLAVGMSNLMGTQDQVNLEDITKPTWLGVPMPDGSTISLLPTMAIPRMASRSIQNAVQAAKGEADFSPDRALEAFAHGRMSPMAGALYDTIHNQDFLGRKYDSNLEKYGQTLANVTLPIIASSFIEDLKEGVKQNAATGDYNWMDIASDAGINLLGKSQIPQHPVDRLNTIAKGQFGTDWNLLTDAEKAEIRKNPAAVAAESEYDFYSMRRAGSQEQRIDSAYKSYENDIDHNWSDAQMIDNFKSSQTDDDNLLAAGKITGDMWRDRYQSRQDFSSKRFEFLKGEVARAGLDVDKLRDEKMARLADGRDPASMAWLVQAAKTEYNGVKPGTEDRNIATPTGEITIGKVNWDKFHSDREAVLAKYPAAVATRIRSTEDAKTPGIADYRQAAQAQQEIESIPRYRGFSAEQGNQIDRMSLVMSKFAESVKGQMGLPQGTAVPGLAQALRQKAVEQMTAAGIIKSQDDLQLASVAILMAENPKVRNSLMNLDAAKAVLANPDAVIYYPYLRHRVPKQLWGRLPPQVFSSAEAQAELAAGG